MPGLIQGLEIARRAMMAQQAALNVIGNNLANVNTPGYSRQHALLVPSPSERTPNGIVGTGVVMDGVERMRDLFLDQQIRQEMGLSGEWSARAGVLNQVQMVLNEPSDNGLGGLMDSFWNAWLDLSNQPQDTAARAVVVQTGQALAEGLRQDDARVQNIFDATDAQLSGLVAHLNSLMGQVADLNAQIARAEVGGGTESNLRDKRDSILDEMATTAGATHLTLSDGSVVIRMGGRTVVQGNSYIPLTTQQINDRGHVRLRILFDGETNAPAVLSGEVGGLLDARDNILPAFLDRVDELAKTMADSVNGLHQAGPSRLPFFRGTTAATLEVASEVSADPTQVNAGTTGDAGDNDIALAIAALRDAHLMNRSTSSMGDFYRANLAELGAAGQQAKSMSDSQDSAVKSIEQQRQAVMGVNLDEELTKMITSQKAYEAAARIFKATSQMIDVMLQM
jgi:flagellar hook-associated protein 1